MVNHNDPKNWERDNNYVDYRMKQLEKTCDSLERFSDELRLDRTTVEVKISQMSTVLERHERDIAEARAAAVDVATQLTARLDELRSLLNDRIGKVESNLIDRIAENKSWNSRWFIGILATVVTSMVLIIITHFSKL